MPKVSEMIQSKFLRKEDLDDDVLVTIKRIALEDMPGDDGERRWVAYFKELPKGLVLNVTTIRTLESALGGDTDDWIGARVTLFVDPGVQFKGKVVWFGCMFINHQRRDNAIAHRYLYNESG